MLLNVALQFTGLLRRLPLIPFIPGHTESHQHSQALGVSTSKR